MIVYHGTTRKSAQQIQKEGFIPKGRTRRVWFAQNRDYARGRARTKAQRANDRPIVLKCNLDIDQLHIQYGNRRVIRRSGIIAVSAPVPKTMVRFLNLRGEDENPEQRTRWTNANELVRWINAILGVKPHKGVNRHHPGIPRLIAWVENQLAAQPNPKRGIDERELLSVARGFLNEIFDNFHVDFELLRTLPKTRAIPIEPTESFDPDPDPREMEALDCLMSPKAKRRQRGLKLLAALGDPDLFDWCAMALADDSVAVRVEALKVMRQCEDIDPILLAAMADDDEKTVRAAAVEVLALRDGASAQWFWRGVTDPSVHVRMTLARQLDKLDPAAHRDIFEAALYDPHPDVARIAKKLTQGQGFAKVW